MNTKDLKIGILCALIMYTVTAQASIDMSEKPYTTEPEINFTFGPKKAIEIVAPVVPSVPLEIWTVKPASYLQDTLREWATKAGWSLVWGLSDKEDYRLDTGNNYPGDFKTAVKALFDSMPEKVRIYVELRPQNTPPLIFINRDDSNGTR